MSSKSFVSACLSGEALLDDIDDWVDRWHEMTDDGRTLDDFLGFTSREGSLWAEQPSALRYIVAAHRDGVPVEKVLASRSPNALAARSGDEAQAEKVLDWLISTGRIPVE